MGHSRQYTVVLLVTLDVNDPNDYFMNTNTSSTLVIIVVAVHHLRLDAAGGVTTLATYDILDFHLEIDYAQAAMGNYSDVMAVNVYLELIEDFTGVLPVDPLIPSVYLTSSDLVQHTDGYSIMGAWEIYGSSIHTFSPLNSAQVCP